MYAVISLQGHQYIVSEWTELVVDNLSTQENEKMVIDSVVAVFDENWNNVRMGTPFVEGVKVEATVGNTQKGEKVHVIKFKRKNRYFRNKGFRPLETVLVIDKIVA